MAYPGLNGDCGYLKSWLGHAPRSRDHRGEGANGNFYENENLVRYSSAMTGCIVMASGSR